MRSWLTWLWGYNLHVAVGLILILAGVLLYTAGIGGMAMFKLLICVTGAGWTIAFALIAFVPLKNNNERKNALVVIGLALVVFVVGLVL